MRNIHPIVRDNYEQYCSLMRDAKQTSGAGIDLSQPKGGNNPRWRFCQLDVVHSHDPAQMCLITEVRIDQLYNFKFKLRAPNFMDKPVLNFDSAGPTHRNEATDALSEQAVTTPHFNCYDEQGRRIAYKTEQLNDPDVARQLEGIESCVIHFYEEAGLRHSPADYPAISLTPPGQLPFPVHPIDDPHANVANFI